MKVHFYKNPLFLIIVLAFFYRYYLDLSYLMISDDYPIEFPIKTNYLKVIISYIILIPLIGITYREKSVLSYLFRVIVFFTIIPLSSIYAMKDESNVFFLLTCISFVAVELVLFKKRFKKEFQIQQKNVDSLKLKIVRYVCFFILSITLILMYVQLGTPSLMALVLDDIYDLRQSFQISSYTNYILYVSTQVCIPFGIADGYIRKSKKQILTIILFQFLFFLWTGHKTWFFSIFLMFGMIFLLSIRKSLDYLFVALTALCMLGYYGNDNLIINKSVTSLINRRVLLDPAALKFNYYDYFVVKGHHPNLVAGTVLAPIFSTTASESEEDYAYTISEIYTDKSSNAGTGLYGGDVASVGIFVFLLVPLSLVFLANITRKTEYAMGRNFTLLLLVYIFFSFNDQRIIQYLLDIRGVVLIAMLLFLSQYRQVRKITIPLRKKEYK